MTNASDREQILAGIINDMMHEAKVFAECDGLPMGAAMLLKLSITANNFVQLFQRFEIMRQKVRTCAPDDAETPVVVTYTYQLPEHKDELRMSQMSHEMYSALWDIQNKCRSVLKHGSDLTRDDLAEEIQDMCWQVDLDCVN